MRGVETVTLPLLLTLSLSGAVGCTSQDTTISNASLGLTLEMFRGGDAPCYNRTVQPQTAVVDTHVHFRPFGGPAIPFEEVVQYFEETGVLFANIAGIGQMLPVTSSCTYYLDCPGTLVTPTLKNDFVNAADYVTQTQAGTHLTLAMTFPDLSQPASVLSGMHLLEHEYPGAFTWMGEVNLVKQALFANGHDPVPSATISDWAPFMERLRARGIPLALHADLGNAAAPDPLSAVDGGGAAPVSRERDCLGPHGPVARTHRHGRRSARGADDVAAGSPSEPDAGPSPGAY